MAGWVRPAPEDTAGFRGLDGLYEYTNDDGTKCRTNCGQAAAATLLTHHGKLAGPAGAAQVMAALEEAFPPDQFFGWFGTGRRQVERICQAHGLAVVELAGEEALRAHLDRGHPVVVMLGLPSGRLFGRFDLPGGHWMVAYGYDTAHVYLSNYGRMAWADFRRGWGGLVPWLIAMNGRGLVAAETPG